MQLNGNLDSCLLSQLCVVVTAPPGTGNGCRCRRDGRSRKCFEFSDRNVLEDVGNNYRNRRRSMMQATATVRIEGHLVKSFRVKLVRLSLAQRGSGGEHYNERKYESGQKSVRWNYAITAVGNVKNFNSNDATHKIETNLDKFCKQCCGPLPTLKLAT